MTDFSNSLCCSFENQEALYLAYMPFVKGGGLFIRTNTTMPLHHPVNLLITLFNEPDSYPIEGRVVWVTSSEVQNGQPGIGVQFVQPNAILANKIASSLKDMENKMLTDTM